MSEIFKTIQQEIDNNKILLFMKGDEHLPQCGFSAVVVQVLQKLNVQFKTIDVLQDLEIRQGIKDFSDWPTIPQLYIAGEFIGGCDIVKEMFTSGDLEQLLRDKGIL